MKETGSQTLKRAIDILFVLGDADRTLNVSEIAEHVKIPESTAYRLKKQPQHFFIRTALTDKTWSIRILNLGACGWPKAVWAKSCS